MKRSLVLAVALAALLAGCATPPPVGIPSAGPQPSAEATGTGAELIGLWRVGGAPGETPDTWLRLDAGEVHLWRPCGVVMGSWAASAGHAVFDINGWLESCSDPTGGAPAVPWLHAAAGYRPDGDGWRLVDAGGATVGTLRDDGAPEPNPNLLPDYARPPTVTPEKIAALAEPAALPAALAPATPEQVLGRWLPVGFDGATEPYLEFGSDGSWTASDGCNGASGRWQLPGGGRLLATTGATTLIGCEGVAVPSTVSQARRAGLDHGRLVLVGQDGVPLLALDRG